MRYVNFDLSENFKFLEDQRKPVKIIYKTSANQEFNDIIAERLHEVSNLHLKIDKTYDLYSNNSRHYATLIFDYFRFINRSILIIIIL